MLNSRFVEERSRLGFGSANALAAALGVSQVAVKRIEDGLSVPGGEMLAAFAAIGGDVGYVLSGNRSGRIDPQLLGICEAAIRRAYLDFKRVERTPGPVRSRIAALVYNQLVGRIRESDDVGALAVSAAELLVDSLVDPVDEGMLERNLFAPNVPAPDGGIGPAPAGVTVQGDGNRVAGRDMVRGSKGK